LIFDKDDQLAVEFVSTAANIRAYSFGIPLHSLFEAKGVAGNIVHAVATTNAIIAGLIVIEAIKVLRGDYKNYRYLTLFHLFVFDNVQCAYFSGYGILEGVLLDMVDFNFIFLHAIIYYSSCCAFCTSNTKAP
jgi:hypothetical protein